MSKEKEPVTDETVEKESIASVLPPKEAGWLARKLISDTPLANFMEAEQRMCPAIGILQGIESGDLVVIETPTKKTADKKD